MNRIKPGEETAFYTIRVPISTRNKLRKIAPNTIRSILYYICASKKKLTDIINFVGGSK